MDTKETVAEKNNKEWVATALSGSEPFTDGVTPEVLAWQEQRRQAYAAKKEPTARQRRAEYVESVPLLRISKALSKIKFQNPLTDDEVRRVRNILNHDEKGKEHRRGCGFAFLSYMRAQFYAGHGMRVLCIRRLSESAEVFRVADMARHIFWKYRKPGCFGAELTNEHLNFTTQRLYVDIQNEPEVVALLNQYRDELLKEGIFSEDPASYLKPATTARKEKRYRTATVMSKCAEIEKRMDMGNETFKAIEDRMGEMAKRLDDIKTEIEGIKSHNTTAQAVAINALNEQQKKLHEVAVAQDVHKTNLKTAFDELSALQNKIGALTEQVSNVVNIALRLAERVDKLEAERLNTPPVVPYPAPRPPFVPSTGPIWPDTTTIYPTATCEKSGVENSAVVQ